MTDHQVEPQPTTARSWLGIFLVISATVFWSTSGIFISFILGGTEVSPVGLAFWRDLGTFVCLFIGLAIFAPRLLKINGKDIPWLVAMGTLSIGLFHVLWNTAVLLNGVGVATVIQSTAPLFVTIAAWILWKESLRPAKIIAIVLAGIGIYLIARPESLGNVEITLLGVFIGLLSAIFYGSFSLFGKRLTGDYNPWTILVYVFGVASLVLLPFQFTQPIPWPVSSQVVLFYIALILLTTIFGFALYTAGLQRLPASVASITSNTEVPFAAILAYLILGERMSLIQILGAFLVIMGVILVSIPRVRGKSSSPEAERQETPIPMD
jgi:drug/metabolite transporter (DMT)-like permease